MSTNRRAIAWALAFTVGGMVYLPGAIAQEGSAKPSIAAESIQKFKDNIVSGTQQVTPKGWETGNLSERGAKEILTDANFAAALEASAKQPVFVFKHSTECPISGAAYRRVADWLKEHGDDAPPIYLVKVIERRPVSKNIEAQLKVKHESPQLILLNGKKPAWNASHDAIVAEAIDQALESIAEPAGD